MSNHDINMDLEHRARFAIADMQERVAELEHQLAATEANEQVLVDANKHLLARVAELENLVAELGGVPERDEN